MSTVQLVKTWSTGGITPNLRRAFTSLNDLGGWFIFQNTQRLNAKWTRKWESNGVTGPANAADNTQRLTNVAACSVRATIAGAAQSYGVYTAANGAQILITYQGASDDVLRIAYSPGGLYTLAGTTTFQPTATDEVVVMAGTSVVNATASLDRVMSIWCLDGDWRCAIYRSNGLVNAIGVSLITSLCSTRLVNPIFSPPLVGYRFTDPNQSGSSTGYGSPAASAGPTTAAGAANFVGIVARVYTDSSRIIRAGGGQIWTSHNPSGSYFNTSIQPGFTSVKPALQNGEGSPLLPLYWNGERQAQMDGFLGVPIDWWCAYTNNAGVPTQGDPYTAWDPADTPGVTTPRSNWLMTIGSACIWPWCNVAANMETT